jgi:hypothetical protein
MALQVIRCVASFPIFSTADRGYHRAGDDWPDAGHARQPLAVGVLTRDGFDLAFLISAPQGHTSGFLVYCAQIIAYRLVEIIKFCNLFGATIIYDHTKFQLHRP